MDRRNLLPCHPLLHPDILSNIFKYLDKDALRSCRSVCTDWEESSFPFWRREAVFNGYDHNDGVNFAATDQDGEPFRKYVFDENFQRIYGPNRMTNASPITGHVRAATHVRLDFNDNSAWDLLREIFASFEDLASLELVLNTRLNRVDLVGMQNNRKIKSLKLVIRDLCWFPTGELLRYTPFLDDLTLQLDRDVHHGNMIYNLTLTSLFRTLKRLRRHQPQHRLIKHLKIQSFQQQVDPMEIPQNCVRPLLKCQLPLETLAIDLPLNDEVHQMAGNILSSYSRSLKQLSFSKPGISEFCETHEKLHRPWTTNIVFSNLTSLLIRGDCLNGLRVLRSLTLSNLKELGIVDTFQQLEDLSEESVIDFFRSTDLPNLTKLNFKPLDFIATPNILKVIGERFSDLAELKMALDASTLRETCRHFRKLQSLEVYSSIHITREIDDESTTGIWGDITATTALVRQPNLTSLASLERLVIHTSLNKSFMSFRTIQGAILELDNLVFLEASFIGVSTILQQAVSDKILIDRCQYFDAEHLVNRDPIEIVYGAERFPMENNSPFPSSGEEIESLDEEETDPETQTLEYIEPWYRRRNPVA